MHTHESAVTEQTATDLVYLAAVMLVERHCQSEAGARRACQVITNRDNPDVFEMIAVALAAIAYAEERTAYQAHRGPIVGSALINARTGAVIPIEDAAPETAAYARLAKAIIEGRTDVAHSVLRSLWDASGPSACTVLLAQLVMAAHDSYQGHRRRGGKPGE